jgi:predicted lipoprotein with Yx(FWY)xxD motif
MTRRLRTPLLVLVVGITLAGAACGGDDDDASDAQGTPSETTVAAAVTTVGEGGATTTAATATETAAEATETTVSDRLYGDSGAATTVADAGAAAGAATVEVVESSLGEILASDGTTLYAFLPDDAGPSTCSGDCAVAWPPLEAAGDLTLGEGLDAGDFATAPREGGEQVTFFGWPLYFYSGDSAPGDVTGQGLGNSWYVVAPDGTLISD